MYNVSACIVEGQAMCGAAFPFDTALLVSQMLVALALFVVLESAKTQQTFSHLPSPLFCFECWAENIPAQAEKTGASQNIIELRQPLYK